MVVALLCSHALVLLIHSCTFSRFCMFAIGCCCRRHHRCCCCCCRFSSSLMESNEMRQKRWQLLYLHVSVEHCVNLHDGHGSWPSAQYSTFISLRVTKNHLRSRFHAKYALPSITLPLAQIKLLRHFAHCCLHDLDHLIARQFHTQTMSQCTWNEHGCFRQIACRTIRVCIRVFGRSNWRFVPRVSFRSKIALNEKVTDELAIRIEMGTGVWRLKSWWRNPAQTTPWTNMKNRSFSNFCGSCTLAANCVIRSPLRIEHRVVAGDMHSPVYNCNQMLNNRKTSKRMYIMLHCAVHIYVRMIISVANGFPVQ